MRAVRRRRAPDGTVEYLLDIRRGRRGSAAAPDLRVGVDYADLVELHTGEQHVASAFMRGVLALISAYGVRATQRRESTIPALGMGSRPWASRTRLGRNTVDREWFAEQGDP